MVLFAVILVFGMAGSASAVVFTLESYDVTLDPNPGLELYWNPILTTPVSGDLEVGDSITFALFELGTNEDILDLTDTSMDDISVSFDFSSPEVDTVGFGFTSGNINWDAGSVLWDNPVEFSFGSTGLFTIHLENDFFGAPGSTVIDATLTYVTADSAPVPEPSTILLLGAGLLGLVGYNRKRFSKKS